MSQTSVVEIPRITSPATDLGIKLSAEVTFNNIDLITSERFNAMIRNVVKYVDLYQIDRIDVITQTYDIDINDIAMLMGRGERIVDGLLEFGTHAKEVNVFISHNDKVTFFFVRKRLQAYSTIKVNLL